MAGFSVGQHERRGRRALDHDLPLVPFIDFMVCLIAFLMVTAVWTEASRINATARAPGGEPGPASEPPKELHVTASSRGFDLSWRQGATVLDSLHVPRAEPRVGSDPRFPALAEAITAQWNAQGSHRDPSDRRLDRAVLHVQNDLPFEEIIAVLDALHAPRGGRVSAFDVALAAN